MLETFLHRFRHLHTDRSQTRWTADTTFRAPHKPLLLLSVLDQAAEGLLSANLIETTPDLLDIFGLYWTRVMPDRRRGSVVLPFFHLRSEDFWQLVPVPGQDEVLLAIRQIDTMRQLRTLVLGATLDEELYGFLQDPVSRESLRHALVEEYVAPHLRIHLYEQGRVNQHAFTYSQELLSTPPESIREYAPPELLAPIRSQGFRRAVTLTYERRCSLCGIRVVTPDGHTSVDASHIVPWSSSHDDRVTNGLALCRLCHWCFDEGLLSISHRFEVIASRELTLQPNAPGHLSTIHSRPMIRPADVAFWPDLGSLEWHRKEVFRRG